MSSGQISQQHLIQVENDSSRWTGIISLVARVIQRQLEMTLSLLHCKCKCHLTLLTFSFPYRDCYLQLCLLVLAVYPFPLSPPLPCAVLMRSLLLMLKSLFIGLA